MSNHFFADLHSHITLYPYNRGIKNEEGMLFSKDPDVKFDVPINYSQTDLSKMAKAGVRIVFASLYPVETGFMRIKDNEGILADMLINVTTLFSDERINTIQSDNHSYFGDLVLEYSFLKKYENKQLKVKDSSKNCMYKIVENYTDLKSFLDLNDDYHLNESSVIKIAIILTIEGCHSLFPHTADDLKNIAVNNLEDSNTKKVLQEIKKNIAWAKSSNVFSITFAHHFKNYLCGYSISFHKKANNTFHQEVCAEDGFSDLGKEVIKELQSNANGQRRIIIDVKHMSVPARNWYFSSDNHNNHYPVIASHTAVNKYENRNDSTEKNKNHDEAEAKYRESNVYNTWDLNLSDQEIVEITKRDGLIGISLDEGVVMGYRTLEKIKEDITILTPENERHKIWSKPVFDTIIYIAQVLQSDDETAGKMWDVQCIGSDFDGMINPLNAYRTVLDYPTLRENLILWFKESVASIEILNGKSETELIEIVNKIMNKNCLQFLKRNF